MLLECARGAMPGAMPSATHPICDRRKTIVFEATRAKNAGDAPRIGVEIRGTRKDVRIADIVAASGTRRPDAASAPKAFRQAFIYVVAQARETSDDLNKIERIRGAWETFFSESTEGRGTMIARLLQELRQIEQSG